MITKSNESDEENGFVTYYCTFSHKICKTTPPNCFTVINSISVPIKGSIANYFEKGSATLQKNNEIKSSLDRPVSNQASSTDSFGKKDDQLSALVTANLDKNSIKISGVKSLMLNGSHRMYASYLGKNSPDCIDRRIEISFIVENKSCEVIKVRKCTIYDPSISKSTRDSIAVEFKKSLLSCNSSQFTSNIKFYMRTAGLICQEISKLSGLNLNIKFDKIDDNLDTNQYRETDKNILQASSINSFSEIWECTNFLKNRNKETEEKISEKMNSKMNFEDQVTPQRGTTNESHKLNVVDKEVNKPIVSKKSPIKCNKNEKFKIEAKNCIFPNNKKESRKADDNNNEFDLLKDSENNLGPSNTKKLIKEKNMQLPCHNKNEENDEVIDTVSSVPISSLSEFSKNTNKDENKFIQAIPKKTASVLASKDTKHSQKVDSTDLNSRKEKNQDKSKKKKMMKEEKDKSMFQNPSGDSPPKDEFQFSNTSKKAEIKINDETKETIHNIETKKYDISLESNKEHQTDSKCPELRNRSFSNQKLTPNCKKTEPKDDTSKKDKGIFSTGKPQCMRSISTIHTLKNHRLGNTFGSSSSIPRGNSAASKGSFIEANVNSDETAKEDFFSQYFYCMKCGHLNIPTTNLISGNGSNVTKDCLKALCVKNATTGKTSPTPAEEYNKPKTTDLSPSIKGDSPTKSTMIRRIPRYTIVKKPPSMIDLKSNSLDFIYYNPHFSSANNTPKCMKQRSTFHLNRRNSFTSLSKI